MKSNSRSLFIVLATGLMTVTAVTAGIFRSEPYPSWRDSGISQKLNLFTFYEENDGLKVFAGSETMRFHDEETYVPMLIAVGNGNPTPVRITPSEFILTDDQGVYYPLADHKDMLSEYKKSGFDRRMVETSQFLGSKFVAFK